MKKISYIVVCLFVSACASFEPAVLVVEKPLAHQDSATMNAPSKPVMDVDGGIIYGSSTNISKWVSSHGNLIIGKTDGALVVNLKGVGQQWEQLSRKFSPLDFTDGGFVIVKSRVDIGSPDSLKMRIDLIDEDGMMTNYYPQEQYIRVKEKSKTYKFIYADHWEQGWPVRGKVNAKKITEVRINFNGGLNNYTGKLIIDEIVVSDGKKKIGNPNNYVLFDFSDGTSGWWSANSIVLATDDVDDADVLKLDLEECGPAWEGIGYKFNYTLDFAKTPIVKVRLKSNAAGKLRMDINDVKDYSTNANPLLIDFNASEEYVDLFYNFTDRFAQSWPVSQVVDATQIQSIKFHVNPPENPAFTGRILIDDISLMSLEEYEKYKK